MLLFICIMEGTKVGGGVGGDIIMGIGGGEWMTWGRAQALRVLDPRWPAGPAGGLLHMAECLPRGRRAM
jgi:hypothetical protein